MRIESRIATILNGLVQSSPEHPDILTNLAATTAHLEFSSHGYHAHLSALPSGAPSSAHVPTEAELETYVPTLPSSRARGVDGLAKPAPVSATGSPKPKNEKNAGMKRKTRHKLPKGAVEGKPFTEDVSWTSDWWYLLMDVFASLFSSMLLNHLLFYEYSPIAGSLSVNEPPTSLP